MAAAGAGEPRHALVHLAGVDAEKAAMAAVCAGLLTVQRAGTTSPATTFSAKSRQPARPQAPQLLLGSSASTSSMRGSS